MRRTGSVESDNILELVESNNILNFQIFNTRFEIFHKLD